MAIPDASNIEVANAAATTPPPAAVVPPQQPIPKTEDFAFLNDPPDEYDSLPPDPKAAPVAPTQPTATAAPVVQQPTHPPSLIEFARQVGIGDRQINKLDSDELLELVLKMQSKPVAPEPEERRRRREPEPEPVATDEDEALLTKLEVGEDGYGLNKDLIGLLRKKFKSQRELEAAVTKQSDTNKQLHYNQMLDSVEAAIENLGAKFEKVVGKGSIVDVSEAAKERRNAILAQSGVHPLDAPRTIAQKITKAATKLYGDILTDAAEVPVAPAKPTPVAEAYTTVNGQRITKEEWERAGLARPTDSRPAKPRGQRAAEAAVAARMQEFGVHQGAAEEQFDGLPK